MKNNQKPAACPLNVDRLVELMEDAFSRGERFRFLPTGQSMRPMLRAGRDSVVMESPKKRPPAVYDVVFYRRENGQLVLHRIVARGADGFTLCGDGQTALEPGIADAQILGVLAGFYRNARYVSADALPYRLYARVWTGLRPVRRIAGGLWRRLRRMGASRERSRRT